ncbi:MAG TPA: hypothetical protein VFN30_09350 [Chitinophagaceae bacterium]|nr:hypothetical protein [Chitinophagaceae bacterium]
MKKIIVLVMLLNFIAVFLTSCASGKYGCPTNSSYSRKAFNK